MTEEKLQTAFDPPLVSENNVAFFPGGTKICNEIFRIGVTPPHPLEVFRKIIQILESGHLFGSPNTLCKNDPF